jgi:folate-binding protein YgfZ
VLQAVVPSGAPRILVAAIEPPTGRRLDDEAVATHRVAAGEPRFGRDVDDGTIPQETGLVPESVSFTKGCFVGQELVARIDSRGHVNRVLRRVVVAGVRPPPGSEVVAAGAVVGVLGTVAPAGGGAAALALLHRETAPGEPVLVRWEGGEATGSVEEIVRDGRGGASQISNSPLR